MKFDFYETPTLSGAKLPFVFQYNPAGKSAEKNHSLAHWHSHMELLLFTGGKGAVLCDTHTTPVNPGDIFIINENSLHCVVSTEELCYYSLTVDNKFCIENDIHLETLLFQNHVQDGKASALFTQVAESFADRNLTFYHAAIRSAVLNLLVYLARFHSKNAQGVRKRFASKTVENIKATLNYIHAHFTQKLSISEVAGIVNLSQYHFSREFKKATGVSFVKYVNSLRCENARKLMQSGKYTVAEACMQSGFENLSYFSKTFKLHCGHSPNKYIPKA